MKLNSVKRRVAIVSVLLCLAVITVSAIWVYIGTRRAILQVNDAHFQEIDEKFLKLILLTAPYSVNKNCDAEVKKVIVNTMKHASSKESYSYMLLNSQGDMFASSENAPPVDIIKMRHPGINNINDPLHNRSWRGVTMQLNEPKTGGSIWLWFGEDKHLRNEAEEKIAIPAIVPLIVATPLLCLLLVLSTNLLFVPINRLEREVSRKSITNLTPLDFANVPMELFSLVKRLNFLFHEVDAAWQREKRFNQDAAHELRTPLAVIMLNAENALEATNLEERKYHLEQIKKSIKRSERTIEQLLTSAKIENGLVVDFDNNIDLACLLRDVIAELVPLALKQRQDIMLDTEEGRTYKVQGNEIFLCCLFRNLIDNAIRYSGEGTRICATFKEDDEHVQVVITDNGRGMTQEEIERVFERFFRGRSTQNKVDGVGLGMAIVKRIVSLHQGRIDIRSEDTSLAFVVTLPKVRRV